MRIGINGSSLITLGRSVSDIAEHARQAEADGFSSFWLAQLAAPDALTTLALAGERTSAIELGTAVIPTWPRHPLALAGQALTVTEAIGPRLVLGIGLAHKPTVEQTYKIPFERPAQHMDEYLSVLLPLLTDRKVQFTGDFWSAEVEGLAGAPTGEPPAVMLAAMGPRMLRLAGERTAGTILWLSGPRTVADHIAPSLTKAAADAGRPAPRIVASVPVCVTSNEGNVRAAVAEILAGYNDLPSYRGVMDREGVDGPAGVAVVGDEAEVRAGLQRFADAGTTDFAAVEFVTDDDETARTRTLLKELAAAQ